MSNNLKTFKEFAKVIPADSYVIIIKDRKDGSTDFMSYDTSSTKEVTTAYLILRGIMSMCANDIEPLLERGELSVYRDILVKKPTNKNLMGNEDNVVHIDFEKE